MVKIRVLEPEAAADRSNPSYAAAHADGEVARIMSHADADAPGAFY